MDDEMVEVAEVEVEPLVHQIGKYLIVAIAGFIASKLATGAYDATLQYYHNRQSSE